MESTIVNCGRSLLRLINGILDFSRIEAGRIPSEVLPVDLSTSLRSMFVSSLVSPAGPTDVERAQLFVPAARSLSILVAEDNRTNQMVIEKILERAGHRATLANNDEAALDALQRDNFDLVLMDVDTSIMNGIESAKLYRFASIGQTQVPIVALTADATSDAWTRCQEAGMDGYATKPIEPARLLEIIDSVVSRAEIVKAQAGEFTNASTADHGSASDVEELVDLIALADLERLGGQAFISGLASQFSDDAAERLSSLRAAVAEENVKGFRDAAHALRGSAANLGATKVFSTCLALRSITPVQLAVEGDALVNRLVDDVDDTIEILKAHVAAHCDDNMVETTACRSALRRKRG